MDLDSINTQKKELGQYPAILTSRLVINPYLLISHFRDTLCFCFKTSPRKIMSLICMKQNLWRGHIFIYEWFCRKTRFDSEAKATRKWSIRSYQPSLKSQETFFSAAHATPNLQSKHANKIRLGISTPKHRKRGISHKHQNKNLTDNQTHCNFS